MVDFLTVVGFKDFDEGLLRDRDFPEFFHLFLALFLLVPKFAFAADVAAVTFGCYVFGHGVEGFSGDDFAANSCLDGDFKHLARDHIDRIEQMGGAVQAIESGFQVGIIEDLESYLEINAQTTLKNSVVSMRSLSRIS